MEFDFEAFGDVEVLEDENVKEIERLEKKNLYYFSFSKQGELKKVIEYFGGENRLDTDKLISLIEKNEI